MPHRSPPLDDARHYELGERDRLILEHVPLLRHIVTRMAIDVPRRVEREDLEAYGMLGLIRAADTWEPERGLKFSTYAFPKIRGAILDELRRMDFLSRGLRERVRALERAVGRLEQESGAPPAPEALASELGIDLAELDELLAAARSTTVVSLEDGVDQELGALLSDPSSDDPVGSAEWEELKQRMIVAIASLPEQEKTVITLYYGEELLLKDIGNVLGVTESRVSQIHSRALYRLNCGLRAAIGAP